MSLLKLVAGITILSVDENYQNKLNEFKFLCNCTFTPIQKLQFDDFGNLFSNFVEYLQFILMVEQGKIVNNNILSIPNQLGPQRFIIQKCDKTIIARRATHHQITKKR